MLIALWVTAGATVLLALTSVVAVATWRENRRRAREIEQREHEQQQRDRDAQQQERTLDATRKEFAPAFAAKADKGDVSGLKSNLAGGFALAAVAGILIWDTLRNGGKGNRAS